MLNMCLRVFSAMDPPGEKARDTADWDTPAAVATSYDVIDLLGIVPRVLRGTAFKTPYVYTVTIAEFKLVIAGLAAQGSCRKKYISS